MIKRNLDSVSKHHSSVENWLALIGVLLAAFAVGASIAAMTGCASSAIKVGANGLDVSDSNPFGETNISYLKMHKTATTLDLEAADYGKAKGTVVQALAIGAGLAGLAITGSPIVGGGAAVMGAGVGMLPSDGPTSATATAAIARALSTANAAAGAAGAGGK